MTRNGAPFHGAIGEAKTVRSAASAPIADAAAADDSAADRGDATTQTATGNNVAAVTANPRARSIRNIPSRSNLTAIQPRQCGRFAGNI